MLNQANQIKKVLNSNCKTQLQIFDFLAKKMESLSQTNRDMGAAIAEYELMEQGLHKWRKLLAENKILLRKYLEYGEEQKAGILEKCEVAVSTQIYIEEEIQRSSVKWPAGLLSQFLMWSALQQLQQYIENIIAFLQRTVRDFILHSYDHQQSLHIHFSLFSDLFNSPTCPELLLSVQLERIIEITISEGVVSGKKLISGCSFGTEGAEVELDGKGGEPEGPVVLGARIVAGTQEHEHISQHHEGIKRYKDEISYYMQQERYHQAQIVKKGRFLLCHSILPDKGKYNIYIGLTRFKLALNLQSPYLSPKIAYRAPIQRDKNVQQLFEGEKGPETSNSIIILQIVS